MILGVFDLEQRGARPVIDASVAKPPKVKAIDAWELADVTRFLNHNLYFLF